MKKIKVAVAANSKTPSCEMQNQPKFWPQIGYEEGRHSATGEKEKKIIGTTFLCTSMRIE